jgi:hypothetical protein
LKRKILRLRGALTIPDRVVCRNSTVALDWGKYFKENLPENIVLDLDIAHTNKILPSWQHGEIDMHSGWYQSSF